MRRPALLLACCLAAVATPATAVENTVTSGCRYVYKSLASSLDHVLVVVVAEAHATGLSPAVTTTVTCTVRNSYGEEFTTTGVLPGPNAYWTGSAVFRWDTPEVCSESSAVFLSPNGSTVRVVEDNNCRGGA